MDTKSLKTVTKITPLEPIEFTYLLIQFIQITRLPKLAVDFTIHSIVRLFEHFTALKNSSEMTAEPPTPSKCFITKNAVFRHLYWKETIFTAD